MGSETKRIVDGWEELDMDMRPRVRFWVPAAAMEEQDLRKELQQLKERGFGGVEVVVLSFHHSEIDRGEDGWGSDNWNRMVAIIEDETSRLGMAMDLANGPGWPISTPKILSADDPAALCELTFGVAEVAAGTHYQEELPERGRIQKEGTPVLLHVLAYQQAAGTRSEDKVLDQNTYLDLMKYVSKGENGHDRLDYVFPETGRTEPWILFAFYHQPAVQKTNSGSCYVIDHLSKAGVKACEAYWDEVLEQYPLNHMESFFCDSLEYQVGMEWTPGLERLFEKQKGYSLLPWLPFIGIPDMFLNLQISEYRLEDMAMTDMLRHDYGAVLTWCYCHNHLEGLEEMAEKHGKTIRYQVAYNKPYKVEDSALYVTIPENEALQRGAVDSEKTMAAAVHLGRKKRYSFECSAEFGYSYGQDYEDLFWWIKRGYMAGMNAQVLHGASYSGRYEGSYSENHYLKGVEWPGYEGFGKSCSNYWNRTLSVSHARGCLDTITRMNTIFRKNAKIDCAIYRDSYGNPGTGSEFFLYPDNGALTNFGYSYEFVTEELLNLPVAKVTNHQIDEAGVGYQCLIVQESQRVSYALLLCGLKLCKAGLPVVWIGKKPVKSSFYGEWHTEEAKTLWKIALEELWSCVIHVDNHEDVPEKLRSIGIDPRIKLDGKTDIMTAVRMEETSQDVGKTYYVLYSYNRITYQEGAFLPDTTKGSFKESYCRPGKSSRRIVEVGLKGQGIVYACNPWTGREEPMEFVPDGKGYMKGQVCIEEDEIVLLALQPDKNSSECSSESSSAFRHRKETVCVPVQFEELKLYAFEPDVPGEKSFLRSGFSQKGKHYSLSGRTLQAWHELAPELEHFSGKGIYSGTIELPENCLKETTKVMLELGNVCDTMKVFVNGKESDFPDQVLNRVDITELVHSGKNELQVEVVSNLYNCLFDEHTDIGVPGFPSFSPRSYGIWESEGKPICCKVIG